MSSFVPEQDLLDPRALENPGELYRELRRNRPVCRVRHAGTDRDVYVVTTYELVMEVLRNPGVFSSDMKEIQYAGLAGYSEADEILAAAPPRRSVLQLADDPAHQLHRSLFTKAFSPSRIRKLDAFIDATADALIDSFITAGECDFIEDFAARLPVRVIARMLGIPEARWNDLRRWSDAYLVRLSQGQTREEDVRAARDMVEALEFFRQMIEDRRHVPGEDLVSDLLEANARLAHPLDDTELLSLVEQLAIGGAESSRNAIGGAIVLLLEYPDQLRALRADMALLPNAVEEVLRFFSPVSANWRVTKSQTRLGDVDIPAGSAVLMRLDAANHDPQHFVGADRFDVRRPRLGDHVGFGQGVHYCLGQMLARRELSAAIRLVFSRLPNVSIDRRRSDLTLRASLMSRATRSIFLKFDAPQHAG